MQKYLAVDHRQGRQAAQPQGLYQRGRLPMPVRGGHHQPLAAGAAAASSGHLRGRRGLAEGDQVPRGHAGEPRGPALAEPLDVGAILLGGAERLQLAGQAQLVDDESHHGQAELHTWSRRSSCRVTSGAASPACSERRVKGPCRWAFGEIELASRRHAAIALGQDALAEVGRIRLQRGSPGVRHVVQSYPIRGQGARPTWKPLVQGRRCRDEAPYASDRRTSPVKGPSRQDGDRRSRGGRVR